MWEHYKGGMGRNPSSDQAVLCTVSFQFRTCMHDDWRLLGSVHDFAQGHCPIKSNTVMTEQPNEDKHQQHLLFDVECTHPTYTHTPNGHTDPLMVSRTYFLPALPIPAAPSSPSGMGFLGYRIATHCKFTRHWPLAMPSYMASCRMDGVLSCYSLNNIWHCDSF